MTAETTTLSALLSTLIDGGGSILTFIIEIGSTIASTPVLALGLIFFVTGGAIGIFGRLLSRN